VRRDGNRGLWWVRVRSWLLLAAGVARAAGIAQAGSKEPPTTLNFGPYNVVFLGGGIGLSRPLSDESPILRSGAPWSMSGWLRVDRDSDGPAVVAAVGEPAAELCKCLVLAHRRLEVRLTANESLKYDAEIKVGTWHAVAATYDGRVARLYVDGAERAARDVTTSASAPMIHLAPETDADPSGEHHFGGALALFSLDERALTAMQVQHLYDARPDSNFSLISFHHVGEGWPWQEHAWRGLQEPQPAWTLPHGRAAFSKPVATPQHSDTGKATTTQTTLAPKPNQTGAWTVTDWHLAGAPGVHDNGERLSQPDYDESSWYPAVVPGTVLTTLIANGVFPDPDYGLDNLSIPESLNRQDYWYRARFIGPPPAAGRRLTLTFKGINYAAEIWLNGARLGVVRGAFIRGIFDVSALIRAGQENGLAVRISPPPHPGIPHEQSVAAGPGENGGSLALDGPTFVATEGWDWIPGIRDRNSGLWQDVELTATGPLRLLDPQVVTRLPLPRTDTATVQIRVPVENPGSTAVRADIEAAIEGNRIRKHAVLEPGVTDIVLEPSEFKELRLIRPRLWWPNGYGPADLYTLELTVRNDGTVSDTKSIRFGVRQVTYELSLFDHLGNLRRVEVDPTSGSLRHERLVDVRHEAIKRTASGWAESLTPAGERSPAVRDVATTALTPYLVIRVNGIPIAARGGNWGMDDSRKRIARERLEPYFRLHRDAHLNIIRNWVGQSTEDVFYDLADEYGLLVLNDFWASTQDFQVEPQDPQLFLANARDVIRRYRNHPSIALWFGRNEGVPQPILNEGLADLIATEDGTRFYTGSSNAINLQGSGPYNWRPPQQYFTDLARGFSVEVGTPSLASLESLRKWIPEADRWPIDDTYAYHDWHFGGNGDTATFMRALESELGPAQSLEDFERKAQLMSYVSHRAIFEGFQAHLWSHNSGRLLWMTHPAWPSNTWQIYTSDYDTPAAYYAVAKACEPVHAQLNLPDFSPTVVNIGLTPRASLKLTTRVLSLDDRPLLERVDRLAVTPNAVATLAPLPLNAVLDREGLVVVSLTLTDAHDSVLSRNVYWEAADEAGLQRLSTLAPQGLTVSASAHPESGESTIEISLENRGNVPALLAKLTVLDAAAEPVLPAFYSDNYLTLLPHETRHLEVRCPDAGRRCTNVALRGWNVMPLSIPVTQP